MQYGVLLVCSFVANTISPNGHVVKHINLNWKHRTKIKNVYQQIMKSRNQVHHVMTQHSEAALT